MTDQASAIAPEVDWLFHFVHIVSLILFLAVIGAGIYFMVRYRRRDEREVPGPVKESAFVEAGLIIGPTLLVLVVFTWGFQLFLRQVTPPPDAYEIKVRAKQWAFEFEYPNGTVVGGDLHVPGDRPIKLTMTSIDVLHSMFLPAMRAKYDIIPGRYTTVWFDPTKDGTFELFCTEYCGASHSGMIANVVVQPFEAFDEWLSNQNTDDMPLPELGAKLYQQQACQTCHSADGTPGVGPTFAGLWGQAARPLEDGSTVAVDADYLYESIVNPSVKIAEGYMPLMPASYASLSERQVSALIEYIKTLQ